MFIAQYVVKFENGMECGGAYMKLLSQDPHLKLVRTLISSYSLVLLIISTFLSFFKNPDLFFIFLNFPKILQIF